MDIMVRELEGMGYSLNAESMVDLLSNSKYISKVTVDTIELDSKYNKSDKADKDSVRKLAVKTAKQKVKK